MKKLFVIIAISVSLISCTKQVSTPSGAANQNVFFKNVDVAVDNIVALPITSNSVTINFSTDFEHNISRIELMSSASASTFCTLQGIDVTSNASTKTNYSFTDSNIKGSTMYYMLRFKDISGNWIYSPYISVKIN